MKVITFELSFKNDAKSEKTTVIVYLNNIDLELRYLDTKTDKVYKSWEKMVLKEYKDRGLINEKYEMYSNVIWEEKNV